MGRGTSVELTVMRRLLDLVGHERALATTAQALHFAVQELGAQAAGAMLVTCADDLREAFASEGLDRLAILHDESRVPPPVRALYAAVVSARLQARKVVLDVQDSTAGGPTVVLVVPCVTINRQERDTELVCGLYTIDGREGGWTVTWSGLGDDPGAYGVETRNRQIRVTDEHVGTTRPGRDHRALVARALRDPSAERRSVPRDPRLERLRHDVAHDRHRNHHHVRLLLRAALPVLAEVAPVPAAAIMFAEGAAGIHHAFRIHRLTREMEGTAEARQILEEVHDRIDGMDPDRAEALVELLAREYAR